jgi:hypothetical protein
VFDLAPDWAVANPEEPFHPIDGDGGVVAAAAAAESAGGSAGALYS